MNLFKEKDNKTCNLKAKYEECLKEYDKAENQFDQKNKK